MKLLNMGPAVTTYNQIWSCFLQIPDNLASTLQIPLSKLLYSPNSSTLQIPLFSKFLYFLQLNAHFTPCLVQQGRGGTPTRHSMRETRLEFDEDPEEPGEPGWADRVDAVVSQQWQKLLDLSVPYIGRRWAISALVACVYCVRAYLLKGWYIVSYGLAIYQLSLLIGFLTPQAATYCLRCSA